MRLVPVLSSLLSLTFGIDGVISLDFHKSIRSASKGNSGLSARDSNSDSGTVSSAMKNNVRYYAVDLYFGSNKQHVVADLDTGSSDLWVMSSANPHCSQNGGDLNCGGEEFDPESSETFEETSTPWGISYYDRTYANGVLGTDTVSIGGLDVVNQTFGFANNATAREAILGVGFQAFESTVWNDYDSSKLYPTFTQSLREGGYINSVAYSMYLNSPEANDGAIIFGGVDHSKYTGVLGLMPIVNVYPGSPRITSLNVMLNGISVGSGENACELISTTTTVLLDSGTTFANLPETIVSALAESLGYTKSTRALGFYTGPCDKDFGFDNFELNFSGLKLTVSVQGMLVAADDSNTGEIIYEDGKKICALATDIGPTDHPENYVLGDVFLRNFYVVFDLEKNEIALGQARYNTGDSDVEAIISTIPGATSVSGYSNTQFDTSFTRMSGYQSCIIRPASTA